MRLTFSKVLKQQFTSFIECHPPQQFSAGLRRLVFDFISSQVDTGFHIEFNRLLWSLNDLFDLLDEAETEIKKQVQENNSKKSEKPSRRKRKKK